MLADLRLALRALRNSPGFTFVAVAMLALGIGASTACFSFLNAFFLHRPPFARPAELVALHGTDERSPGQLQRLSLPNFFDYRAQDTGFTELAFHTWAGLRYRESASNIDLFGQLVSGNYFTVLGTPVALGRPLLASDDTEGAPFVVVVSHAFWKSRLGADPAAIGRTLLFNQQPFTLVGVAPENFRGITLLDTPDFWVPWGTRSATFAAQGPDIVNSRRAVVIHAFGRLKPGVTLAQAEATLRPITRHLAEAFPADNATRSLRLTPLTQTLLDPNMRADMVRAGNLLMALSGLILLIACGNLANLLLARAGARQREVALRAALGASRGQIVRQLLAENCAFALLGGILGVVLSFWLRDLLWALRPRGFAESFTVEMDGGVLAFAVAATVLTGLLFGLVPALTGARSDLVALLKRASKDGSAPLFSMRNALVAAQVALSVVALVIAGLFLRSLQRANAVNLGWNARHLALLSAGLGREGYDQTRALDYYQRALERLRSVPGVVDASISTRPFLTGENPQRTIRPQGADEMQRTRGQFMSYANVMPGYLPFMGIELVAGRDFTDSDNAARPPVVIVNEALAHRAWPGEDPVGKKVKLYNDETEVEVVGVTRNIRDVELKAAPAPFLFFPTRQQFSVSNVFHVRVAGDPVALLPTLRRELAALDPAVNVFAPATYDDLIRHALWGQRTGAALMAAFGGLALLLTTLGIYAVMAHTVGQRTREIGIRLAIGAQAHAVLGLVLRRGVIVTGAGLLVGLAAAFAGTRYIRSFLYGVEATDPLTFAVIAGGLIVVAVLACWLPARRAMKVDPLVALRAE